MRRVALGRTAIFVQLLAGLIFVGYTLAKKDIRVPLISSEPYEVRVVLADAKGLDPADEPPAAVAGSPKGRVSEVEHVDGRAVVTLRLDPAMRGRIFRDARAAIRPASALQNLLVNVDPGSPEAGALADDEAIEPEHTASFVAIDELTSVFDADTQASLQILLAEAHEGLAGREGELRDALVRLGRLSETAAPLSAALAERRRLLARLVAHLDTVFTTLGTRGDQLAGAIDAGSRTLAATSARSDELARTVRELAPTLREARRALVSGDRLSRPLVPALEALEPTLPGFERSVARLRRSVPQAGGLLDDLAALTRDGREPLGLLRQGTRGLRGRLAAQKPVVRDLLALATLLDRNKEGLAQTADTLSGAFSTQDNGGVHAQVDALKFEAPKPENFGGDPARARMSQEELDRLALALERTCLHSNPYACLARFAIPGLPERPVSRRGGDR